MTTNAFSVVLLLLHYAVQREVMTTGKGPLSGRLSMGEVRMKS